GSVVAGALVVLGLDASPLSALLGVLFLLLDPLRPVVEITDRRGGALPHPDLRVRDLGLRALRRDEPNGLGAAGHGGIERPIRHPPTIAGARISRSLVGSNFRMS